MGKNRWILAAMGVAWAGVVLGQEPELWFYYQTNLLPEENIRALEGVWKRAAAAGYRKVLLADYKFGMLGDLGSNTDRYLQHVAEVRKLAEGLGLEIVPAVFGVGYSNNLLGHDPNLAEGLPVRDALLVVKGGEARIVADPPVALNAKPDRMDGSYTLENGVATTRGHTGNARLLWKLGVSPYRCYHVSVKVKTQGYTGEPEIKPIAGRSRVLSFTALGTQRTQDWKECHVVFDSLDNRQLSIYMGVWGDAKGVLEWKDWKIEEAGPVNILRRAGAPCVVKGYVEGKDYEPIVDPALGRVPWPGEYQVWHDAPAIRTKLPEGTPLRVSWYFPVITHGEQVMMCPSEEKAKELLADEARRVRAAFGARSMMMSHDEVRVLNQDESCQSRRLTPGQILADNVAYCTGLLKGAKVYVWSDMFDPYHNAEEGYYLVNGTLAESWKGLEPSVTIVNWNFEKRDKSLAFFAGRGHSQVIAGYYDGSVDQVRQWMASAKDVPNVTGVMYTTWEKKYDDLEAFAKAVKETSGK